MKNPSLAFAVVVALSLPACTDHNLPPTPGFQERTNFIAERLYPEGITYSPRVGRFLVSSITQGKIGTVAADGRYEDFLSHPQLISSIGIHVRNESLYVVNGDMGVSVKSTPATARNTAELFVFNLDSRQLERRVDLDDLLPGVPHFANDVAIDDQGNAYVTDSFAPVIYKVTASGQASILVNDPRFSGMMINLNGIVYHPNGYLLAVKTNQSKLFKIDLRNGNAISEVAGFSNAVAGGDGMTLVGNDLYVVNGQGSLVTQVRSTDNWQSAALVKTDGFGYSQATTNVEVGGQIYSINARIGEVSAAGMAMNPGLLQSRDYSIQRFK